jgi:hypothetical protein
MKLLGRGFSPDVLGVGSTDADSTAGTSLDGLGEAFPEVVDDWP